MTKHSRSQGFAHAFLIIGLVVVLLGALGFIFWQNFMKSELVSNIDKSDEASKNSQSSGSKSGVVVLENSDMNKYVNYENDFEFQFPKQIYTYKACEATDKKFDNYGNSMPSESHYGTLSGAMPMTVIKSGNEYLMVPSKTVVLSSPKGTPEIGYIYKSCDVFDTTAALVAEAEKDNFGIKNIALERNSFKVENAHNKEEALNFTRKIFNDYSGTVNWVSDAKDSKREKGEFIYSPNPDRFGGGAYRLWYYPRQQKVVYISLGQSLSFQNPDGSNKYYMPGIEDTFKFNVDKASRL